MGSRVLRDWFDVPAPVGGGGGSMIAKIDTPACGFGPEVHAEVSILAITKWFGGGGHRGPVTVTAHDPAPTTRGDGPAHCVILAWPWGEPPTGSCPASGTATALARGAPSKLSANDPQRQDTVKEMRQ
jgi:hypothetical protein